MKTKRTAVLLVLVLVLGLASGCRGNGASPDSSSSASTAPSEAPGTGPGATPSTSEAEPEISLPLTDKTVTITVWQPDAPHIYQYVDNWDEANLAWPAVEKATNVHLEFIRSMDAAVGLSTIIASGDLPDLFFEGANYYTGGLSRGVEDDVFLNLNDYLETKVPNYWALLQSDPDVRRSAKTSDGDYAAFYVIADQASYAGSSGLVRGDWVKEFGMSLDDIDTYDELHSYLQQALAAHGGKIYLPSTVVPDANALLAGFGTAAAFSTFSKKYPFYQIDGKVKCGLTDPALRDWLTMMNQWWGEGLISDKFMAFTVPFNPDKDFMVNDGVSYMAWSATNTDDIRDMSDNPDYALSGVKDAMKTEGEKKKIWNAGSRLGSNTEISTTAENLDLILKWVNYNYTKEGTNLWVYGTEGVSFNYDADGNPQYTDLILHNEKMNANLAESIIESSMMGPHMNYSLRLFNAYSQNIRDTLVRWDGQLDYANNYNLPPTLNVAAKDADAFNQKFTEIATYVSETLPQFLTGDRSLNEWDGYVAQLKQLGIEDCTAMFQTSYDNYLKN